MKSSWGVVNQGIWKNESYQLKVKKIIQAKEKFEHSLQVLIPFLWLSKPRKVFAEVHFRKLLGTIRSSQFHTVGARMY